MILEDLVNVTIRKKIMPKVFSLEFSLSGYSEIIPLVDFIVAIEGIIENSAV